MHRIAMSYAGLCLIAIALMAVPRPSPSVEAAYAEISVVYLADDAFYNYDFGSKSLNPSNVDWPMSLFFYNGANINRVKQGLQDGICPSDRPGYNCAGSDQDAWIFDGDTHVGDNWDDDGGRKQFERCYGGRSRHYRVYADDDDNMIAKNTMWGQYVIGTTHVDVGECDLWGFGDARFCCGEETELNMVRQWHARFCPLYEDCAVSAFKECTGTITIMTSKAITSSRITGIHRSSMLASTSEPSFK